MRFSLRSFLILFFLLGLTHCGFHKPHVRVLPKTDTLDRKILFIGLDGMGYAMMKELKDEGYYRGFSEPIPLIVPFPSATTIGFTGIFQALDVGTVPGYETRFYSFKDDKIIGGTPFDVYKIPINYKYYFDSFRHTMTEKAIMYGFPGVAGMQDLERARRLVMNSPKKVVFSYLGGTDGAQHLLGRNRTKRFMKFMDSYLERIKKEYENKFHAPLEIVLFSDHGFHYDKMHLMTAADIEKVIKGRGFKLASHLRNNPKNVVTVRFGLLSAGALFTHPSSVTEVARLVNGVEGIDLVFWPEKNRIYVLNGKNEEAYFEYESKRHYKYVSIKGDPLHYLGGKTILKLSDDQWFKKTWNEQYPDAGYRLYDAFHHLVENKAGILFSLKPKYQFGSMAALTGTQLKFGHKGTHGALFQDVSQGVVMTDNPKIKLPQALRYDDFFNVFIPKVVDAVKKCGVH